MSSKDILIWVLIVCSLIISYKYLRKDSYIVAYTNGISIEFDWDNYDEIVIPPNIKLFVPLGVQIVVPPDKTLVIQGETKVG